MGTQIKDVDLVELAGAVLASPNQPGVSYRLEELIGEGAHGVVFLALQKQPQGMAPVVVKLLRPRAVRELQELAGTAIVKEVAALKRLSERVPPTPFVVQFLDAGTFQLADSALKLPWVAVEYVHGGLEGTTLRSRVEGVCSRTGFAFDLRRAITAVKAITAGITAIHEVGVLHRDVHPGNVLCCGFSETEVFKLADFGLARVSSASTFGNVLLGTPGYCAPEQSFPEKVGVGPYSDVFGMACTIYFLLTGEPFFKAPSIPEMLVAVQSPERRSLLDAPGLSPQIRDRRALCLELDRELARGSRADPRERHQSAMELGGALQALLAPASGTRVTPGMRRDEQALLTEASRPPEDLRWTISRSPGTRRGLGQVAWDANGRFLATSEAGLVYWDGLGFRDVPFDWPWLPSVVQSAGAGRWLLAGAHGVLVDLVDGNVVRRVSAGNGVHFVAAAGSFDDIVIAAAVQATGHVAIWTWINGRFMEPLPVPELTRAHACAPLTETSWLLSGAGSDGDGVLLELLPLGHRYRVLHRRSGRALVALASRVERGSALAAGADGFVAKLENARVFEAPLPASLEFSAVAVDVLGRQWAATPGTIWMNDSGWQQAWRDETWTSPFAGMTADVGRVLAVTTDGGVIQGERHRPRHERATP